MKENADINERTSHFSSFVFHFISIVIIIISLKIYFNIFGHKWCLNAARLPALNWYFYDVHWPSTKDQS